MTREHFKWGGFLAIIGALTYVPTEWCHYIGGGRRCAASNWQFFFEVSGLNQVDVDRLIIQVVVVLVAIVGLWLMVFKDQVPKGRVTRELKNAKPAASPVSHSTPVQAVPVSKVDEWAARGDLREARHFKASKIREPLLSRVLVGAMGGALLLGGGSILFSIGLAIWIAVRGVDAIDLGAYVTLVGIAAIVGAFFGAFAGIFSK